MTVRTRDRRRRMPLLGMIAALLLLASPLRAAGLLLLERTIPLPDTEGRIDHLAVDVGRGRLFVAELGNGTVDAIDLFTDKVLLRLHGLSEPQGIGYDPTTDRVAVATGGGGDLRLYAGADLAPVGQVRLGEDADNVRLDAGTGRFVVGHGAGALASVDPASGTVVGRAVLPAHPEGFQLDPARRRAYVNLPGVQRIGVVDLVTGQLEESWPLTGLAANFPMALDVERGLLASVTRDPPRLLLLDLASGGVRAELPACRDADDVFFDEARRRLYVVCGAGVVEVYVAEGLSYARAGATPTRPGARTGLFVPALDRLFVAARGAGREGAAILVLRPVD